MQSKRGKQSESSALDELFLPVGPLFDLVIRIWCAVEKMKADRVANAPAVEVAAPTIHLSGCDALRFVHKSCQHPRLKITRSPKPRGEVMVAAQIPGQLVQCSYGDAKRVVRRKSVTCQAVASAFAAQPPQFIDNRCNVSLGRAS